MENLLRSINEVDDILSCVEMSTERAKIMVNILANDFFDMNVGDKDRAKMIAYFYKDARIQNDILLECVNSAYKSLADLRNSINKISKKIRREV